MNPLLKPHLKEIPHNGLPCVTRVSKNRFTPTMGTEFRHVITTQLEIEEKDIYNERDWGFDISHFLGDDEPNAYQFGFCICGKEIKHIRYILYKPQGIYFQVGNDCIEKNLEQLYKNIKKTVKELKRYRQCIRCGEYKIKKDKPDWQTKCKECYIVTVKSSRGCSDCGKALIDKPTWQTKCYSCYSRK